MARSQKHKSSLMPPTSYLTHNFAIDENEQYHKISTEDNKDDERTLFYPAGKATLCERLSNGIKESRHSTMHRNQSCFQLGILLFLLSAAHCPSKLLQVPVRHNLENPWQSWNKTNGLMLQPYCTAASAMACRCPCLISQLILESWSIQRFP